MSAILPVIFSQPNTTSFTEIEWNGQRLSVEYQLISPLQINTQEKIIFLHEGLGCISMWKSFPEQLCHLLGMQGMVYSRPGYGKSSPLSNSPNWTADFMHLQAKEILPLILKSLNWLNAENSSEQKLHLLGHSDGASIAIIFAAQFPQLLSTLTVLAPHTKVENITLEIGALSCVELEALTFAFEAVMTGSLAEHAELTFKIIDGQGRCFECGQLTPMTELYDVCTHCGHFRLEIVSGLEMKITELKVR